MSQTCKICKTHYVETDRHQVANNICEHCLSQLQKDRRVIEEMDSPVLLMQGNPRQVITGNEKAQQLFAKQLEDIDAHRGGEVFDCIHSFSEAGCGKDTHCEGCIIKEAIVDTFATAKPHSAVLATLTVKKNGGLESRKLQISTEKVGEMALVKIERYDKD